MWTRRSVRDSSRRRRRAAKRLKRRIARRRSRHAQIIRIGCIRNGKTINYPILMRHFGLDSSFASMMFYRRPTCVVALSRSFSCRFTSSKRPQDVVSLFMPQKCARLKPKLPTQNKYVIIFPFLILFGPPNNDKNRRCCKGVSGGIAVKKGAL